MRRMSAASRNLRHRAFGIPGLSPASSKRFLTSRDLGITAVELLPIFDFDETAVLRVVDGKPVRNFWGYSTIGFFAPQSSYCLDPESGGHLREFRDLVKAMHKAGIEVILDVVFNHTDEGNHQGPTYSFKGIDNRSYYLLVPWALQYYMDFSGCGNTFNCNHPHCPEADRRVPPVLGSGNPCGRLPLR